MLRKLLIGIIVLGVTACIPSTNIPGAAGTLPSASQTLSNSPVSPTATQLPGGAIEPAFTLPPTSLTNPTLASSTPSITNTPIPKETEAPAASSGPWKIYTNPAWKFSIDYPSNWSVSSNSTSVVFTPGQSGIPIQLSQAASGEPAGAEPLPNTHCVTFNNPFGVQIKRCLDTVSLVYNAEFTIQSQTFSISTKERGEATVYEMMLNSIHED